jgi:hypothetical protein
MDGILIAHELRHHISKRYFDGQARRSDTEVRTSRGSRASEAAPKALLGAEKFKTPITDFDLPPNSFTLAPINDHINPPELPYTDLLQRILTVQESDYNCKTIRTLLKRMDAPFTHEELELTKGFALSEDDLLIYNNRLYVPDNHDVKIQILQQCHDTSLSGQLGQAKTYSLVARHYHWPGMRAFINTYVKGCDTCQRNKTPRHLPVGLLQPLPIPSGPCRSISIDAIVKLPKSDSYDSIMVIVCRLTKMAHFLPFNEEGFTLRAPRHYVQLHLPSSRNSSRHRL